MKLSINTWYIIKDRLIGIMEHDIIVYQDKRLYDIIGTDCVINAENIIGVINNAYKIVNYPPKEEGLNGKFITHAKTESFTKRNTYAYSLGVPKHLYKVLDYIDNFEYNQYDYGDYYRSILEHTLYGIDAYRSSIKRLAYVNNNYLFIGSSKFINIIHYPESGNKLTLYPDKITLMFNHSELKDAKIYHYEDIEKNQVSIVIEKDKQKFYIKDVLNTNIQEIYQQNIELLFREIISQELEPIMELNSVDYKRLGAEMTKQDVITLNTNGDVNGINFKNNHVDLTSDLIINQSISLRDFHIFTHKAISKEESIKLYKYINSANKPVAIMCFNNEHYILSAAVD